MMIFETKEDLEIEKKAIELFVNMFEGSYKKLDQFDIDYKVFDKDKTLIAYAEVKGLSKIINSAYPLLISARKIVKLADKRLNPIVIWCCQDGIIYGKVDKLVGEIKWGGRTPRENSYNDTELMIYYDKQSELKYIKFT